MVVGACYRCATILQPLPKEQWFINVSPLKEQAIKLIKTDQIQIHPKRFKKQMIQVLEGFIDWNISRQIVWGIQIPAYRCVKNNKWFVSLEKPENCEICKSCNFVQDEDTFDTWFSSGQWPFATLKSLSSEKEDLFNHYYPTTVMETGYDIMRAWVSRMVMLGYFATKKVPFKHVFYHGMVRDKLGQKMSKSKGNVINPLDMVSKYGADALRGALVFGTKEGGDLVLSEEKIRHMRNFANKIWNMGRFMQIAKENLSNEAKNILDDETTRKINALQKDLSAFQKKYKNHMDKFEFARAFDLAYEFTWHKIADIHIENLKEILSENGNLQVYKALQNAFLTTLRAIHPYLPFVTEAVWQSFFGKNNSILFQQEK
jgi:valyl-tRNA synthetase